MSINPDTPNIKHDLPSVKKAAKQEFQNLPGVEGFGIGDGVINVYVSNADVVKKIPSIFQDVTLNFINTGIIEAFHAQKSHH